MSYVNAMDILIILAIVLVAQLLLLRLLVAVMKRLIPQMVPQIMGQVKDNIPKINIGQALGFGLFQFFSQGGIQLILEQFFGLKMPQQPPPQQLPQPPWQQR